MITFIGDVHGWPDRLARVLDRSDGELVFIGDLIDRGPDSRAVVATVRSLEAMGRARCIMGNHEYALVRGVGVPELGIASSPELFANWIAGYGGDRTVEAYGADPDPASLRAAMGDDLTWMAGLPWVLEGMVGVRHWIAVHAGLGEDPLDLQLQDLRHTDPWWQPDADLPYILYAKEWVATLPCDLPPDSTVVSGHVPLEEVYVTPNRLAIDTSGGLPDRVLSAVVWPELRVVDSEG